MKDNIATIARKLDRMRAEYAHACRTVIQERTALERAEAEVRAVVEAQQLVQNVAEIVQQQAHQQIAAIVTRCLRAIFGEDAYEFRIDFRKARGKTEASLLLTRDGVVIDEPTEAVGGGVVDVIAFALRLASLLLSMPRKRRLLVVDEPFRHLSARYIPAVRDMLLTLANELKVQIVFVTHNRNLVCGKVIEIGE